MKLQYVYQPAIGYSSFCWMWKMNHITNRRKYMGKIPISTGKKVFVNMKVILGICLTRAAGRGCSRHHSCTTAAIAVAQCKISTN